MLCGANSESTFSMSEGKEDGLMDKAPDGMLDKAPDQMLPSIEHIVPIRWFRALNVGDAKEDIKIPEHLWTRVILALKGQSYEVEEAMHEGERYFRCVKPYKTLHFEKLWNFECECADYVNHKIIVVKNHSSWSMD